MWDPEHLTTLQASIAGYGHSFLAVYLIIYSTADSEAKECLLGCYAEWLL
jgi:hypothetical protein